MMKATLLCLCVGVLGAAAQVNPLLVEVGDLLTPDGFAQIDFVLHSKSGQTRYPIAKAADLLADPAFVASRNVTAMYFHGFQENNESPGTNNITTAFVEQDQVNVIAVDYGAYCGGISLLDYTPAFLRLPAEGLAVATAINRMVEAGLPSDKVWLIGHSLGGQLVANVAEFLSFKPTRITGLDPAAPGFAGDSLYPKLSARNAKFVDVIHTDAGVYGYPDSVGSVDFWPNGGQRLQPGCTTPIVSEEYALTGCSHQRSWMFFTESIKNLAAFPGVVCGSYDAFQKGQCAPANNNVRIMGQNACDGYGLECFPSSDLIPRSGNLYLRTAAQSPYGLILNGIETTSR